MDGKPNMIHPCKMDPNNIGIDCRGQKNCEKCGWNPKVAKKRHESTINILKKS